MMSSEFDINLRINKVKYFLLFLLNLRKTRPTKSWFISFCRSLFCCVLPVNELNNDWLFLGALWTVITRWSQIAALSSRVLVGSFIIDSAIASCAKRERPINYECQERRADIILLPCLFLIKQDKIKNAFIRTGWVLITHYIINQGVYCSVI